MKRLLIGGAVITLAQLAISATWKQDDPWKVPANYEKLKNPVVADQASISSGKDFYKSYCRSCHGKDGKGSGIRAENLDHQPTDFTSEQFQQQTDGSLLYKIYFGHKEMPGFKKKLPGCQEVMQGGFGNTRVSGDLVNYLRSFSKNKQLG
jgi:mono/diheme cytochrome c family protein